MFQSPHDVSQRVFSFRMARCTLWKIVNKHTFVGISAQLGSSLRSHVCYLNKAPQLGSNVDKCVFGNHSL